MISSQSRAQYREGYEPSDNYADEVHFSPDLDPMEPSFEAHPRGTSGNKRSLGRELLRLVVYGLVIITVSGAAFASQYGDDRTIQTLRTLKRAVSGLSPGLGIKPPEGAPKSLHQVTLQETALVKMRASCNLPQRKSPRNPLIRFDSSLKRLPAISLLSGAS